MNGHSAQFAAAKPVWQNKRGYHLDKLSSLLSEMQARNAKFLFSFCIKFPIIFIGILLKLIAFCITDAI